MLNILKSFDYKYKYFCKSSTNFQNPSYINSPEDLFSVLKISLGLFTVMVK